jgi:parvulin-like peptidyl-prolyl isomerase
MGVEVASQVFNVDSAQQRWLGPFSSDHGQHLLFINAVQAAVVPELDSIRGRVEHDYRRELQQQQFDKAFDALRNAYRIDISNALQ